MDGVFMKLINRLAPDISVVIPCYNEEENVRGIVAAVAEVLGDTQVSFEIILIDNASDDATVTIAKELCAADSRVRLIANNKNYGQMRSPTYGIFQAQGRAVIGMCADFQDPPALLPEFIARWRAGARIVLGVREAERSALWLRSVRGIGYAFFSRFGDYRVIPGATGFGLYDREVIDALAKWREPEPFFRGMLVESGFDIETLPFRRPPRAGGRSSNNIFTLANFAISGLASSSKNLLRFPLWLAFILGGGATVTAPVIAIGAAIHRVSWSLLWFPVAELHFSLLLLFVGLIGEQVRLISERTRNTPLVIEKERINFSA
jgi:glycosyltransferase involved in cell wall biosynthesis